VNGDPARLEQVIVNLLHNAAKYTDEAGGIWLTLHSGAEGVVLRVRDTGIGIAPDTLPLIFKLFMQAERSLDRAQGGLGVGLTLVQKLVEMHGGTVEAISAGPGQGSEFTVRLPSESPQAVVVPPQGPAIAAPAPPRRVLVVDDNADAADIISMLLTHDGHQVRTAYTGTAALAATKGFTPDFVLLDVGLPDMDGYTVARTLRRRKKFEKVCIVAFTGYGQESDRQKAGAAGFDEHLVKPVEYARLQELLSRASPRSAGG
jgi:two-component system CheB/CheR fusion protein